jgi:hypothetical protein
VTDPTAERLKAEFARSVMNGTNDPTNEIHWVHSTDWPAFWSDEQPMSNDWAIEPIVPAGRQVSIWARAKVGKSLLLLDLAAAAATGRSVLGQPGRDPVDVVYADLEMSADDLRDRMSDLGYGPDSDLSHLHYFQGGRIPPLDTAVGGEAAAATCAHHRARLLVVDTMARAVTGEENSSDTYRNFQLHTGGRLRALGVSVVCLDHGGKDPRQGSRGSSAKEDGADVIFSLGQVGEFLVLRCTHSRVPWVPTETVIKREEEPALRHVLAPVAYPAGSAECAELLDKLEVPLDASVRVAKAALKAAGEGRRDAVIAAALKYRRRPR